MENTSYSCLLCCKELCSLQLTNKKHHVVLQTISDLFSLLGISMQCFDELYTTSNINFDICHDCESLIHDGLDLNYRLRAVKVELTCNARKYVNDHQYPASECENFLSTPAGTGVFLYDFRKLVSDYYDATSLEKHSSKSSVPVTSQQTPVDPFQEDVKPVIASSSMHDSMENPIIFESEPANVQEEGNTNEQLTELLSEGCELLAVMDPGEAVIPDPLELVTPIQTYDPADLAISCSPPLKKRKGGNVKRNVDDENIIISYTLPSKPATKPEEEILGNPDKCKRAPRKTENRFHIPNQTASSVGLEQRMRSGRRMKLVGTVSEGTKPVNVSPRRCDSTDSPIVLESEPANVQEEGSTNLTGLLSEGCELLAIMDPDEAVMHNSFEPANKLQTDLEISSSSPPKNQKRSNLKSKIDAEEVIISYKLPSQPAAHTEGKILGNPDKRLHVPRIIETRIDTPQKTVSSSVSTSSEPLIWKCTVCTTACSSAAILTLHNREMHEASKESWNLDFNCSKCEGEFNANLFFNPILDKPYSTTIQGQLKLYSYFYQLCDEHWVKCSDEKSRNAPISVPKSSSRRKARVEGNTYVWLPAETSSKITKNLTPSLPVPTATSLRRIVSVTKKAAVEPKKPKQVYLYKRHDPVVSCVLCLAQFPVGTALSRHYRYVHGLWCCYEDRFSCNICWDIYCASVPGIGIGKISPRDLDHFKKFVQLHTECNRERSTAFSCRLCIYTDISPRELFAHDLQSHHRDEKFCCDLCSVKFIAFPQLLNHVEHAHEAVLKYVCGLCPESFLTLENYNEHLSEAHTANKRYTCFICGEGDKSFAKYRSHMQTEHGHGQGRKNKERQTCNRLAQKTWTTIQRHQTFKSSSDTSCFICKQSVHGPQLLDLHLREVHDPDTKTLDLRFKCKCDKTFKKSDYLLAKIDNEPEYKYPATASGSRNEDTVSTFSQHCNNHALLCPSWTAFNIRSGSSSMECGKCQKKFIETNDYVHHLQGYYKHLLKTCIICGFACKEASKMQSHYCFIHSVKQVNNDYYYCRYCFAIYDSGRPDVESGKLIQEDVDKFKEFVELHASCPKAPVEMVRKNTFSCKFCDKTITNKHPVELFKHEAELHTRNFSVYCHICGAGYFKAMDLNSHVLMSHGEKKFKCDLCPRAFRHQNDFDSHKRQHTNERPFICNTCGKGCLSNKLLKSHLRSHVTTADVPCPTCGKKFRTKERVHYHQYWSHKTRSDKKDFLKRRSKNIDP